MAYNNAIPQAPNRPKDSQSQILANFASIKTLVDIDHVTFDAAGEGKHNKITLPVQAVAPVPAAGDNCIYSKNLAATTKNETYIHSQVQAGTKDTPFSASVLSNTVLANNIDGWTYLPSGLLVKWQTSPAAFNGTTTITLNPAFPAFTNIFIVIPTPYDPVEVNATSSVRFIDILSATQFRLKSNGLTWAKCLVIGV